MYTIKIIHTNDEKKCFHSDIKNLFEQTFSRKMLNFQHIFLDNPLGSTLIMAINEKQQLVGLGHIIFFSYNLHRQRIKFFLFTTSIIHKNYRKTRMYFDILDKIKEEARRQGTDFILAFPNLNALQILTTFGGFKKITTLQWLQLEQMPQRLRYEVNTFDENFLSWRFARFQYFSTKIENKYIIYKNYQEKIDILGIFNHNFPQKLLPPENPIDESRQIIIANIFLESEFLDSSKIVHTNQVVIYPINFNISNLSFTPIFSDVF